MPTEEELRERKQRHSARYLVTAAVIKMYDADRLPFWIDQTRGSDHTVITMDPDRPGVVV